MRIRSFIISYALVLAIVLFADRRPNPAMQQDRYSHVVDLTDAQKGRQNGTAQGQATSHTQIIAPDALIPGTWTAAQIPPERLIAPLVVMDLNVDGLSVDDQNAAPPAQISLDDIANWEAQHGTIPQGAVVAIRRTADRPPVNRSQTPLVPQVSRFSKPGIQNAVSDPGSTDMSSSNTPASPTSALPITAEAAKFLMDARYTIGFAIDAQADLTADRALSRQIALHGSYVVEGATRLNTIPATGSLIIVAPAKDKLRASPVRVLAMVR